MENNTGMTMKAGIFIGRFQPFHNGHKRTIEQALIENDVVIIIIGSTNRSDERNPYSFETRRRFISAINSRLAILGLEDYGDDTKWCEELNRILLPFSIDYELYLYGPRKDTSTSRYIDLILENTVIKNYRDSPLILDGESTLNATEIREAIRRGDDISALIPVEVAIILAEEN
jgi:cytidyltransferase-like protein